jgi:hypothetical protein
MTSSKGDFEYCEGNVLLVEEIDNGDNENWRSQPNRPIIEELDPYASERMIEDDMDYVLDDDLPSTPIRRRSSLGIYAEDLTDEEKLLYDRIDTLVQFPEESDIVEGYNDDEEMMDKNVEIDPSLLEEESIGGKEWIGQKIKTYWNDQKSKRIGFFIGVVKNYRIFNNDVQYEVEYANESKAHWEIIDDGFIFLDEVLEEKKKQILELRKRRGTYSSVPIRRKSERPQRRRISSVGKGRRVPQSSKKRPREEDNETNEAKRRRLMSL